MAGTSEFERTIGFAEAALANMRAFRNPGHPRNYAVWYHFAAETHPDLTMTLTETLEKHGLLSEQDFDALYETHLTAPRFPTHYDEVGNGIRAEVDQMVAMLAEARAAWAAYSRTLIRLKDIDSHDADALAEAAEGLLHATREMQSISDSIERCLAASRAEMLKLHDSLAAIRTDSLTDQQTLLASRHFFDTALEQVLQEAKPFALLVTDIDHFKGFNDRYGHLTGDEVLRVVAGAVKKTVTGMDLAARYGGEEFAIIMPGVDLPDAVTAAESIRRCVMSRKLIKRSSGENLGRVTVSIGVSAFRPGDSAATLVDRADRCLYAAKHAGRNRVICETDPEAAEPIRFRVA